jgi:prefoldin subunit 5
VSRKEQQLREFLDELQRQADELRREVGKLIPLAQEVLRQHEAVKDRKPKK